MNILDKITVTGADDSTRLDFLLEVARDFPMVEFGILCSKNNAGRPRFPSLKWLKELQAICQGDYRGYKVRPQLSCHLCGSWVREFCLKGDTSFLEVLPIDIFQRIQLNFHGIPHKVGGNFPAALLKLSVKEFIFQADGANDELPSFTNQFGVLAAPLYDTSGGAGRLPTCWPKRVGYAGYAGGLSPYNLDEQMLHINAAATRDNQTGPIWIDAETHLRTEDDKIFNEYKVALFIERAQKYCVGAV